MDASHPRLGSVISAASGRVSGEVHTALKPSTPTDSCTPRTKTAPSRYPHLGLEPEQPPQQAVGDSCTLCDVR